MNAGNPFTNLSTGLNPANNFFNSTITTDGLEVPTRTPYGTNTLGTDLDLFNLNNPNESVIPNDESGATLRFTSTGDGYGAFLATFSVEIIEPNIVLEKRVEDIGGNDITGMRTIDGSSNTVCQTDLPPFVIPYPLDDLDINVIPIVIDCNTLEVTVQGTAGLPAYEYAFSEDPANFDPTTAVWQPGGALDTANNPVPAGHAIDPGF